MSDRLTITDNVIHHSTPPGWMDGISGFWWNLTELFRWLPNDPIEWKLFFYIWAPLQIAGIVWAFIQIQKRRNTKP